MKLQNSIHGVNDVLPAAKTVVGHADVCTYECEWGCLFSCDSKCTEACMGEQQMLHIMDYDAYFGYSVHLHGFMVFPFARPGTSIV